MAISSKDLESLWQRCKVEAVPAVISVNQFFESNGVPDHVFEKWYKKKYQAPLVQTVQTLLNANIALGNKQKELQAEADRKIAGLQAQVDKLTGELQASSVRCMARIMAEFLLGILCHDCSRKKGLCLDDRGTFS